MQLWQLAVYGFVGFWMSVLGGIAGAGAGFVMTPLAILFGFTPAQAVTQGKFNGLATTIGSLSGFRKYKSQIPKRGIAAIMLLALAVGLVAPLVITSLSSRWYQLALGVLALVMIPFMVYKRVGIIKHDITPARLTFGGIFLAISLFLQGAFGGGLGSFVNLVLMGMLGMTANEAQITKRWSQLVLNTTIIISVFGAGLIVWPAVVVGSVTGLLGGSVGARIAIKSGDQFAVNIMLILMAISALVLIGRSL